jgi:hypothetical protein
MTAPSPSLATIRKDGGDDEEEDMLEEGDYGSQFGPLDQLSSEIRPSTTSVRQFRLPQRTKMPPTNDSSKQAESLGRRFERTISTPPSGEELSLNWILQSFCEYKYVTLMPYRFYKF